MLRCHGNITSANSLYTAQEHLVISLQCFGLKSFLRQLTIWHMRAVTHSNILLGTSTYGNYYIHVLGGCSCLCCLCTAYNETNSTSLTGSAILVKTIALSFLFFLSLPSLSPRGERAQTCVGAFPLPPYPSAQSLCRLVPRPSSFEAA